jgi:hypothetical protein
MPIVLLAAVAFVSATLLDLVTIAWHEARERGRVARHRGALLAVVHEALCWSPFLLGLEAGRAGAPWIAAAAIAGVALASEVGFGRGGPR